jgi:hypothetical protein
MWGVRGKFVWWLNIIPMQSAYIVFFIKFIRPVFYMWSEFLQVIVFYMWSGFLHVIRFSTCDPVFYMWFGFLNVIRFSQKLCYMWSGFLHVIRFSPKNYADNHYIAKTLSNVYKLQFIIWLRKPLLTKYGIR